MSYILDALRKADAERHLGAAAAQADFSSAQASADAVLPRVRRPWLWMALCLVSGALAAFGWSAWQAQPPMPAVLPSPPQAAPATPLAAVESAPAPPASHSAPAHAAAQNAPPEHKEAEQPMAKPKAAEPKHKKPHSGKTRKAPQAVAPQAATADTLPWSQELPPALRQQLPVLTVNGYLYASNPADRSVLINNRLLREGDNVAPDLVLEKLEPKGMVLNFRGTRYRSGY